MKQDEQKKKLIKAELPGGFRDYGPENAIWKTNATAIIRKNFERFGFDPLETPVVERTEVLTGGEEDSGKIIFNVAGSRDENADSSGMSLRFDLTVPLARFLAANNDIPKPFKRYQIGEVFRGESPQAGRYREFTQADADIVGTDAPEAEAELFLLLQTVFEDLGVCDYTIKINSRELLNTLPEAIGFPEEKLWDALRVVDKKDKIGIEGVEKELGKEFDQEAAKKIIEFISRGIDEKMKGGKDFQKIIDFLKKFDIKNWEIDFSLVRGLSYYTGVIFEVVLNEAPEIGSIASGGRYDNLLSKFTGQPIPAVGASIGVDRLFAGLKKLGQIRKQATTTQALILSLVPGLSDDYFKLASELRRAGVNTAIYLGEDRVFQAQLAFAVKKEIPYVVIMGEDEKKKGVVAVKNLITREQEEIAREKITEYFKSLFNISRYPA